VTHFAVANELLDAQTLRAAGTAPYGGADVGECRATAAAVRGTDLASWHAAWTSTAGTVLALAQAEQAAGRLESARPAFFRASSYFRTAGVMLLGAPLDPRLADSYARQGSAFRSGAALLTPPPEILQIPYEGTTLPGYFFRAGPDPAPRATVILTGGYDGTAEELYFANGAAALARGYHVLAFDGPGQGAALVQQGLVLRPDWEAVITPVVDYLLTRPDVDPDRVALIGLSLGAHLAARAASAEHRLAACIADCGAYDLFAGAVARIPGFLAGGLTGGQPLAAAVLRRALQSLAGKPVAGWVLRRGQLVHGAASPVDYLLALRPYSLAGRAGAITCPVLVCDAEGDDISASAPQLVAALTGEKEYIHFTAAEGAGDHCEAGARTLYHARSFGWLDHLLHPGLPARPQPLSS
jgi:alpha-beta hydrolase superfamily lysophospholipase